jgi:hypothetical protein
MIDVERTARVRWWVPSSWSRQERRWVVVFLGIPVLLFVPLALAGHPAIVADNLLQNYPLRVFSARQIVTGHWPTWNPYSYSGTPLLAGMNAGSFYPGTMLFTFLPGIVAWIANLVVVYWCAAIGLFVLARWLGLGALAAGIAALTYAYGGVMVGQLVHVGVIQGQALLPWIVLCQFVMARRLLDLHRGEPIGDVLRRGLGPTLGLTVLLALVCLTGEPRSIVDAEIVVALVCCCELLAHGSRALATARGRLAYVVATFGAAGVGIAIAAAQLLPGWNYISMSERSNITYWFFGTGSMPWRWLSLFVVPGLLGDNGVAHTSRFFANYNLPEVTVYVGLLALAATCAFAAQLLSRGDAPRRRFLPFFVLVVAGLLFTMGSQTPLGHLFHEIPLFGKTRLQNRNAIFFDFGATILLAWWLDAIFAGRVREASLTGRRVLATAAPVALALSLTVWGAISPSSLAVQIATNDTPTSTAGGVRPSIILSFLVAAGLMVVLVRRVGVRRLGRLLVALAVLDLLAFNLFFETGLISGLPSPFPDTPRAHALLGTYGRIAVVDPLVLSYHQNAQLGFGNLDIFTQLQSVQGYGSLVAASYSDATGARLLGTLGGCQLARGNFVQLRLSAMAISRNALIGTWPVPAVCQDRPTRELRRYFGEVLHAKRVRFWGPRLATAARGAQVVLLTSTDRREKVTAQLTMRGSLLTATFPTAPSAAGVELLVPRAATIDSVVVDGRGAPAEPLNVPLQVGLSQTSWHLAAVIGHVSYFKSKVGPPEWLHDPAHGAAARQVASDDAGDATVEVTSPVATTLVRSVAYFPGWNATITGGSGRTSDVVAVHRDGLVQSVVLPAGTETVEFTYDAPYLAEGLALSAAGLGIVLVGATVLVILRRRSKRESVRAP